MGDGAAPLRTQRQPQCAPGALHGGQESAVLFASDRTGASALFYRAAGELKTGSWAACIRWSTMQASHLSKMLESLPMSTNMQTIVSATQIYKNERQYSNLPFTTLNAVVILHTARQLLHHPRLELSRPREFHFPCSSTDVFAFPS